MYQTLNGEIALFQNELWLPITKSFLERTKKAIEEIKDVELLDEIELGDNVVALKIRCETGGYGLFHIGVVVQTNTIFDKIRSVVNDIKDDATIDALLNILQPIKE